MGFLFVALSEFKYAEGNMKTKTLFLACIMLYLLLPNTCLAGKTTITGKATCIMPETIGFNTQPVSKAESQSQDVSAPTASGASGDYEIKKEEKLTETEKTTVQESSGTKSEVTIYTVCAR